MATLNRIRPAARCLALAFFTLPLSADDWTRFRGPNGSGISSSAALPVEMGPEKNKVWETAVPFGRSSPALAGGQLFMTAVDGGKLVTLAVDRASGEIRWRRELDPARPADLHQATDSATPSPATDGVNVYVFFHEEGLLSYDGAGKERWKLALGPFRNYYGIASSPILAGKAVLLICDQAEGSFLVAVDKDTGKELWRRQRPARLESYSTPILTPAAEPRAVVVSGSRWIDAYDLADGTSVWTLGGVGTGPISSPVLAGDTLFINTKDHADGGWPPFSALLDEHDADQDGKLVKAELEGMWIFEHFQWVDTDASGEITAEDWKRMEVELVNNSWGVFAIRLPSGEGQPEVLWNYRQNVPYIPSPLVYNGVFYMVKDGIVTSLDAATGEVLKRGRLGGGKGKVYASPVFADGKIYIGTMGGQLAVLDAEPQWTVLATNDLGDEIWATPAIADGHLYVRTKSKLYDFAAKSEPEVATAE